MNDLKISKTIKLPPEAVTQTFGILAVKGSGKTYTASVVAEEMLKINQQIIAIDITGAWFGLKSSFDGQSSGFPIAVFGGDHPDVPLEENAGEIIAQAIVEKGFSAIIDLSLFRKAQIFRFLTPFLETLYRLNRNPIHLFADEADLYIPQKVFGEQARTVGAMEDIVRRGRKKGIGCTLITQRPASINKDVLTQCEVLLALRMSHPRDINAIKEWIEVHASIQQAKDMIADLPSLATGEAYIWSPSWLRIFQKIKIRKRDTFDSGATPKPGEVIREPKKLAAIDIKKLGKAIEETVEKKKAEAPRELKKQIVQLRAQLDKKVPEVVEGAVTAKYLDQIKRLELQFTQSETSRLNYYKLIQKLRKVVTTYNGLFQDAVSAFDKMGLSEADMEMPVFQKIKSPAPKYVPIVKRRGNQVVVTPPPVDELKKYAVHPISLNANGHLGKCERSILIALAQRRDSKSNQSQLGILTGYSSSSGSFSNALSKLRSSGYVFGSNHEMQITEDGLMAVGAYEPLPTGEGLRQYWRRKLPKCESAILEYLMEQHPESRYKPEIGEATNYSHTSGSFSNALSKLRTLELIEGYDPIKASDTLF